MARGSKQHKSSDGVPNRKGGSWPNHPSMRYELPIPFSPGADNVTDSYRDGWDRIFGAKNDPVARLEVPWPECDACGERANHRMDAGQYVCERES